MKSDISDNLMLSVRLMTYNHEYYIEEALRGIDAQKTDFDFEVVIGDDFSTDNTLEQIKKFSFSNPRLQVNLLERKKGDEYDRQRQEKGRLFNFVDILNNCKGKYIALLDGDDYWTDPLKLQKQVDFLEENEEYAICFHNVKEINLFTNNSRIIPDFKENTVKKIEDYILNNKTATCSILFERKYLMVPTWFHKVSFGDLALVLIIMNNSTKKGMVLSDTMGVYRVHAGGIHGSFSQNNRSLIKARKQHVQFIKIVFKNYLNKKEYQKYYYQKLINTYKELSFLYKKDNQPILSLKAKYFKSFYIFLKRIHLSSLIDFTL